MRQYLGIFRGVLNFLNKPTFARPDLWLVLVCLIALGPMIYVGQRQYIEYDGYWLLFGGIQDTWGTWLSEMKPSTHPPLYTILLGFVARFGSSHLLYRSISIVAALCSTFLVGRIAARLSTHRLTAPMAALAFGVSASVLEISSEVRSYMLSIFLLLLAFYAFLNLMRFEPGRREWRARIVFIVSSCLAILSDYFAVLFPLICLGSMGWIAVVNADFRRKLFGFLRRSWIGNTLTAATIFGLVAVLYLVHARAFAGAQNHLPAFYFHNGGPETLTAFLMRNLQNSYNLFSPVEVHGAGTFRIVLVLFCLLVIAAIYIMQFYKADGKNALSGMPLTFFLVTFLGFMLASVVGAYPFGGLLRQQFLLFPFLVLATFLFLDRLASMLPSRQVSTIFLCALIPLICWSGVDELRSKRIYPDDAFSRETALFESTFPSPEAVYVDQFNLIGFFSKHHQDKWSYAGRPAGKRFSDAYYVTNGNKKLVLFRDRVRWNLDLTDPMVYSDISRSLRSGGTTSVTVYCVSQFGKEVPGGEDAFRIQMAQLAAKQNMRIEKVVFDHANVFAAFVVRLPGEAESDVPAAAVVPPLITSVSPEGTLVKKGFNVQPDGKSAVSVVGSRFERGAVVVANGKDLDTAFGNADWVTAILPDSFFAAPGEVELKVVNPDGTASKAILFVVRK